MRKLFLFIILFVSALFWFSCEKDVELLAEYEEIPIVYGLIDPVDSISYLRIEKAFLTDGDIFEAAANPDSNQYPYKLNVRMYSDNESITFDTMTIHNKEDGVFFNPDMQVYYAVTKDKLNEDDVYNLEVINPVTGKKVTSSTSLINAGRLRFDYPNNTIAFAKSGNDFVTKEVVLNSIEGGRSYQLNIRFHYSEYNVVTGDSTIHYVDWIFPTVTSDFLGVNYKIRFPYYGEDFYTNLLANIPFKENIERYHGQTELIVSVADETFNTYIEVNKPGTSLVIDRPSFTNIENGYGIFASRSQGGGLYSLNLFSINRLRTYEQMNFQ